MATIWQQKATKPKNQYNINITYTTAYILLTNSFEVINTLPSGNGG